MAYWPTGGEAVAAWLQASGIRHVISIPGSQVLPIWDGLPAGGPALIVPRSERTAAFLAEGYGLAAGVPAALMNTLGPGVANELIGVASAQRSGAPVLALAPWQPPRKRSRLAEVFQGLDHPRYFQGSCKWIGVVDTRAELLSRLDHALAECLEAPAGPVRVEMSFPLLFQRGRALAPPARVSPAGAQPARVIVAETPGALPTGADLATRAFAPGIGVAGFALPVALGAVLAVPTAQVEVRSTPTLAAAQLDTLELSRELAIEVCITGAVGPVIGGVARALGIAIGPDAGTPRGGSLTIRLGEE
jgi:acetolactate synthase I/II/III large subunit